MLLLLLASFVDAAMEEVKVEEEDQRIKTQETLDPEIVEEEDRISLLPDGLIIDEILSRLPSTKYAIRTGALSKRWQHLWPSLPCLHFTDYGFAGSIIGKPYPDFYISVDKTLAQCQLDNLNKFTVHTNYDNRFESHVNNWIRLATSCKVQQLHLNLTQFRYIEKEAQFVLDDYSFFISPHFTNLYLDYCIFNPSGPITWNNLTHLTISNGKLDEHVIANILSGSPLLDTLWLNACYGYSLLDITSKSVKNLIFDGYAAQDDEFDNFEHIIEINAPYISSLRIIGDLFLWKILLRDVSSLVIADLDYTKYGYYETTNKEENEEMLKRFILHLHHVKELKIGIHCYATFYRMEDKGFVKPSNLKVVEGTYYDTDSMELGDCSDNDTSVVNDTGSAEHCSDNDSSVVDDTDSTELGDCFNNDPSVGDLSRVDLQSIAATLGQVQATQRVIPSQLAALLYDRQRYQPLLERLAQEDARTAGVELAAYDPPQVDDQDVEQFGDEGDPAAGREVGAEDDGSGDDYGDVGAEDAIVGPEI